MYQAGFAEIDITPKLGAAKIGWLKVIIPTRIVDALSARVTVLKSDRGAMMFIILDILFVRAEETAAIRAGIEHQFGFPPGAITVAATHNHGGPAATDCGDVRADEAYCRELVARCVRAAGEALGRLENVVLRVGQSAVFGVSYNRRVIQRDGTVKTHGTFDDPNALALEGPIDPALTVIGAQRADASWAGAIVHFTNHPADHGGDDAFSAGWPGVLVRELRKRGIPQAVFINGAFGNIASPDPSRKNQSLTMEETGITLADRALQILEAVAADPKAPLAPAAIRTRSRLAPLHYRNPTSDQIRGTSRGAQRFIDPAIYDRNIPRLLEEIKANKGRLPAEVQVSSIGDLDFVAVPCELFVELGLRIKQAAHPRRALIVGTANGIIGYVPHPEAFARGGYETTFLGTSKMAPKTGDVLVEVATDLLRQKT
ncbi:MAG: hypothetical protein HY299_00785 [Verrucomicrobia bacterium]|nr:hypothetical protein [Verrucomicrobiota bacterium]